MNAKQVYSMLKKLINQTLSGAGALKGEKGEKGENASIRIGSVTSGSAVSVINSGTETDAILDFVLEKGETGPQGEQGIQGVSITGVTKTATSGLIDTYTISYSDGSTSTFQIKNGTTVTKLSELTNDMNFVTNLVDNLLNYYTKTETYTKEEVQALITNLSASLGAGIDVKKVYALPTENISAKTIYLIETDTENVYEQWMYLDSNWSSLGTATLDLSNVYTIEQIDTKLLGYVTTTALALALDEYAKKDTLSKVAFSGKYEDLDGLPTIPEITNVAVLNKLSEVDGELYFDGNPIEGGSIEVKASLITVENLNKTNVQEELEYINDTIDSISDAITIIREW